MCLILFAYDLHSDYKLVLAANRDEFYDRPTAPLDYWQDHPAVLAGRDLEQMGTWMGVTRSGRMSAITNFRDPANNKLQAPSRGHLVSDFLVSGDSPGAYIQKIRRNARRYNGFNLLAGGTADLCYYSNYRDEKAFPLNPGCYGLSNRFLDTGWPKVNAGKRLLAESIENSSDIDPEILLRLLQDRTLPRDDQLPVTGVGLQWERILAPIFIISPTYGTRSSSVLLIKRNGQVVFWERNWLPAQPEPIEAGTKRFSFTISL
jgi:uncharacterized protein with NRDE domain